MLSRIGLSLVVVGFTASAGSLLAGEPYVDFLKSLQREGYGRLAVAYLDEIAKKPDLPKSLLDTMDLERSKSIKISADEAYNPQLKQKALDEAKALMQKFLAANPKHSASMEQLINEGNDLLLAGQIKMAQMRAAKEKAEVDKFRDEAKASFTQAKTNFDQAQTAVQERIKTMPAVDPTKKLSAEREEAEEILLDGRFKLALTDFFVSQTYADVKDPERKKALGSSYKQFDAIYQENRIASNRAAHMAHMWQGRCLEEQGDLASALDCYDEVLVVSPEGKNIDVNLAPLFGQAALFRLRLQSKKKDVKPAEVINDAREWIGTHAGWKDTDVYHGMGLELAKAQFSYAKSIVGPNQKPILNDTLGLATAIAKADTEYKHEAMQIKTEVERMLGRKPGEATVDEMIADADIAFNDKNYKVANDGYTAALAKLPDAKIPPAEKAKKLETVHSRLNLVRLQLALEKYQKEEYEDVIKAAGEIVGPARTDISALAKEPVYLKASNLAVSSAFELFSAAKDDAAKDAAFKRMDTLALFVTTNWPGKPEADDSRMMMAQGYLGKNNYTEAIARLDQVNAESPRYGAATRIAGQIYWRQYWEQKKKQDPPTEAEALTKLRETARARFQTSYDFQIKESPKGESTERMPSMLFETQLYLAEVMMESEKPAEAAKLFVPLVDDILKKKPENIDTVILRTFIGAVRSNLAASEITKAGEAAVKLMEFPDSPQVNAVLIDFTKLMVGEMMRAETAIIEAEAKAPDQVVAKKASFEAVKGVVAQMAAKLSERVLSLPGMLFLGDTCAKVNMNEKARDVYLRILAQVDSDPMAKEQIGKATTRIRAQIVSLLRNEGKFDKAVEQADALIKEHPSALEPLMEKGRILQAWAKTDASKYDDCVGHWTKVRVLLGNQKTRGNDYYEVLLNVAECLIAQSRALKVQKKEADAEARALDAEKMLKSTLTLNSKLSGAAMVQRYNAVIATAIKMQGRNPNAPNVPSKTIPKPPDKTTPKPPDKAPPKAAEKPAPKK